MGRMRKSVIGLIVFVVVVAAGIIVYEVMQPPTVGTFVFQVSDQPNAISDFDNLIVNISKVSVHSASDNLENSWQNFTPTTSSVDLVTIQGDNVQTLISTTLAVGMYTQVRLVVTSASGILKAGGTVSVTVPSGELKLVQSFQISAGETTTFLLDLNVVREGAGYILSPVAGKIFSGIEYVQGND